MKPDKSASDLVNQVKADINKGVGKKCPRCQTFIENEILMYQPMPGDRRGIPDISLCRRVYICHVCMIWWLDPDGKPREVEHGKCPGFP